ncbi:gp47 [Sphingomonas phage PAU]|uniref:gp47 n=1 Tax=Sphingomonas phage PAU TaxID=1150991 RepID=UPI0002573134|nr:gp47 [Sphingomonas phage PAU]AFF28045.1 gp47 [Sphingomonas phage PAU]
MEFNIKKLSDFVFVIDCTVRFKPFNKLTIFKRTFRMYKECSQYVSTALDEGHYEKVPNKLVTFESLEEAGNFITLLKEDIVTKKRMDEYDDLSKNAVSYNRHISAFQNFTIHVKNLNFEEDKFVSKSSRIKIN